MGTAARRIGECKVIDQMWIIAVLLSLVGALFGVLVALLGWLGSKVYAKLSDMAATMHKIEGDLHGKISMLDRRMTRVETKVFDRCDAGGAG